MDQRIIELESEIEDLYTDLNYATRVADKWMELAKDIEAENAILRQSLHATQAHRDSLLADNELLNEKIAMLNEDIRAAEEAAWEKRMGDDL